MCHGWLGGVWWGGRGRLLLLVPLYYQVTNNHPDQSNQAEEIVTTIGQAFEIAFQRFKESKKAQEDFKALKAGVSGGSGWVGPR